MYSDKQLREIFHFLFLERLLRGATKGQYSVKGGVNLRFFYNSPRYSEDLDLDVFFGSIDTLKKNGYKILKDPSFLRVLKTFNIEKLVLSDPSRAKHTDTTQRFKVRLITPSGDAYPTKIEFSCRKESAKNILSSKIDSQITQTYRRSTFLCPHYDANAAIVQKIEALAGRKSPQSRDPFDLFLLFTTQPHDIIQIKNLTKGKMKEACEVLHEMTFQDYQGQVVEYLEPEHKSQYAQSQYWDLIKTYLQKRLANA